MSFLDKYTKDDIVSIIKESKTQHEVLITMGRSSNSGSNRMLLAQYIKDNEIDISHFDTGGDPKTVKDIFVKNSKCGHSTVKRHYQSGNYSEYKCAICGLLPMWNGAPLTLILDHINGIGNDNELSNLRWICANCDRQLPTYGSRGTAIRSYCKKCHKEIKANKSGLCAQCYASENYSGNPVHDSCPICGKKKKFKAAVCRDCLHEKQNQESMQKREALGITRAKLKTLLRIKSVKIIANEYGVAYKTMKRWCRQYGLPSYLDEIKSYSDEDWNNI